VNNPAQPPQSLASLEPAAPGRISDTLRRQLQSKQTQELLRTAPTLLIVGTLLAFGMAIFVWPLTTTSLMAAWLSLLLSGMLVRALATAWARRDFATHNHYRARHFNLFVFGCLLSGVAWGGTPFLLSADAGVFYRVVVFSALFVIASTNFVGLASRLGAQFVFQISLVVPAVSWFFLHQSHYYYLLGSLGVCYALLLLQAAWNLNRSLARTILIGFENQNLVDVLHHAKHCVEEANEDLQQQVSDNTQMQEALHREKERLRITFESIGDGVVITDPKGNIEYMNPTARQLAGCGDQPVIGLPMSSVLVFFEEGGKPMVNPVAVCLASKETRKLSGEVVLAQADEAKHFSVDITASPVFDVDKELIGAVLVFRDMTELRNLMKQMSHQTRHDSLTGLVNRFEFDQRLQHAVQSARHESRQHVLCYLDLDGFKLVNDSGGHLVGDEMLKGIASIFRKRVRNCDTLARVGGDEFALLLYDCPLSDAMEIAESLRMGITGYRLEWEKTLYRVSVSIGLTIIDVDTPDRETVINQADMACYTAKEKGKNCVHVYQQSQRLGFSSP